MTIIVWKDGVLAADQQITYGCDKEVGTKIYYAEDAIIGWSGGAYAAAAFLRWWKDKSLKDHTFAESVQFSPESEDDDFEAIVITKDKVETWNGKLAPIEVTNLAFVTIGSGSSVAKGAIYMGANAIQAVRAAIKYDAGCGYGVQTATRKYFEKLKPKKKGKRNPKKSEKARK